MDPLFTMSLLAFALAAGLVGALFGIGGGIVIVPMLTLGYGLPVQEAVGVSLVGIIATSTGAASFYVRRGLSNVRLAMLLETLTTLGSVIGATLAVYAQQEMLAVAFALLMAYSAVYMLRRPERLCTGPGPGRWGLRGEYTDPMNGDTVEYRVSNIGRGMAASAFAGGMSGMLGIGGGSIKVPIMNIWMGVPIKAATATSNFMVGVTALGGAIVYYANDLIEPVTAATVAVGVFAGSFLGSRLAMRVRSDPLKSYFALLLIAVAVLMMLKGAGVID